MHFVMLRSTLREIINVSYHSTMDKLISHLNRIMFNGICLVIPMRDESIQHKQGVQRLSNRYDGCSLKQMQKDGTRDATVQLY